MDHLREAMRRLVGARRPTDAQLPADFGDEERDLIRRVHSETMTSPERLVALRQAVLHVSARRIPGAIVECGVWRGGSMMAVALTLVATGEQRDLYLFDTFEGMTPPTEADVEHTGRTAKDRLAERDPEDPSAWVWARAGIDLVQDNLKATGYNPDRIHLVEGRVEETVPGRAPERIAILRLDTDWYESTRHELEHLYPRLAECGVLIIDDYGHWAGARRAVDEYLATLSAPPMLVRIDYTARLAIKGS
jgi:O-methyltransferase